ncbi:hypothetical protein TNCV_3956641 [Trichonephila clavipes]|nr:hypothetical protein TNCV_3956641 [Trichonephila clavipes]
MTVYLSRTPIDEENEDGDPTPNIPKPWPPRLPEHPQAYHAIRNFIDREKLESFTYQLNERRRSGKRAKPGECPSDMPSANRRGTSRPWGITLNDCKVMTNRKTGLPMPLSSSPCLETRPTVT